MTRPRPKAPRTAQPLELLVAFGVPLLGFWLAARMFRRRFNYVAWADLIAAVSGTVVYFAFVQRL